MISSQPGPGQTPAQGAWLCFFLQTPPPHPAPPCFPLPPGCVSSENLESRGESFQSPEAYFVSFNSFIETEFMYHNNYHFKCIIQWCLVNLQSCTTVASI